MNCIHRKLRQQSQILIVICIGAVFLFGTINVLFHESLLTQKVVNASRRSLYDFRVQAKSKYERLRVKSLQLLNVQYGWIFYRLDKRQFLNFTQFIFDKVIIFLLVICGK